MTMPDVNYLADLGMTDERATELLELLDKTSERIGAAIANAAMPAELGDDREVLAAQLATVVAYLEHVTGFEGFDDLLRMCRVGHNSSFALGIRPGPQGSA